jgi:uncharacterized protein YdiU (UPF0061 family)
MGRGLPQRSRRRAAARCGELAVIAFDNSYARLPASFYTRTAPAVVPAPSLIRLNQGLCRELDLDPTWLASEAGVSMLAGNQLPATADALAMVYAGHQFGGFNPRLGDGRAILIGEIIDRHGIRRDLQLKGAGRTAYSRGGDGKATLGAALREYVLSEAMFALGVPTTRALAVVTTGETIDRETPMPGAILARVARSHVRIGTFQYFSAQRDPDSLGALANYLIERHYGHAREARNPIHALLKDIVERQAQLIARWMQLGFIHGVMNTDNMHVVGETLDYGPCAFMDEFHPACVFSSIDRHGRYAWNQQPAIAKWNLSRLAEALLPILSDDLGTALELGKDAVEGFDAQFDAAFASGFKRKLGLIEFDPSDDELIAATATALATNQVDFTLFFRRLTQVAAGADETALVELFSKAAPARAWLATWQRRIDKETTTPALRAAVMQGVNPIYIARNHRVEEAIQHGLKGDFEPFHRLVAVLANPYGEQPESSEYERPPLEHEKVRETFCNT